MYRLERFGMFGRNKQQGINDAAVGNESTLESKASAEMNSQTGELGALKQITDPQARLQLLRQKLHLCKKQVDFSSNETEDIELKEVKRSTLLELVDYINSSHGNQKSFSEEVLTAIIDMISTNIFVPLPQLDEIDPDEDDPWLDPTWPHKQVVYELLLRLIVSTDLNAKVAKKPGMIDTTFCVNFINLFEAEDPRERDYLKTILHRIYGKFMGHRKFIREHIGFVFAQFVNETHKHAGIGELLEILGSIINGFALPLKPEHLNFIKKSLIPLHKSKHCTRYDKQLTYCITQYVDKDANTGVIVVTKLVEYWPWTCSQKQVLFLNELEEILEILPDSIVDKVKHVLFPTIARCLASDHFQVSERALFLWNNEQLVHVGCLNKQFASKILPVIYPALLKNIQGKRPHWNPTVNSLSYNVIDLYKDCLTESEFKAYTKGCDADADRLTTNMRLQRWENIEQNTRNN